MIVISFTPVFLHLQYILTKIPMYTFILRDAVFLQATLYLFKLHGRAFKSILHGSSSLF